MGGRTQWIAQVRNKLVETIALCLIPRSRKEDLWDLPEAQPSAYADQALDCALRARWGVTRRTLFPAVVVNFGPPSPEQKRKRLDSLPKRLRRFVILFCYAYFAYSGVVAARMLPQSGHTPAFVVLLQAALLAFALRPQQPSLAPAPAGRPAIEVESIDPDRYREKLSRMKDSIMLGDFSPPKSPLRSAGVAIMVMFMFFAPSYPVVRWLAGGALPDGVRWASIIGVYLTAAVLVAAFLFIWKSSRLAADALQREIDALDAARKKRLSA